MTSQTHDSRSKAKFKAIRERCGVSQQWLATALDVNIKTVKRWENPDYFSPPEDAWELLEEVLATHVEMVDKTVETARRMIAERGAPPEGIDLTYYRSQAQYDLYGRDAGDYQLVNARTREIAIRLEQIGVKASFWYPEELIAAADESNER